MNGHLFFEACSLLLLMWWGGYLQCLNQCGSWVMTDDMESIGVCNKNIIAAQKTFKNEESIKTHLLFTSTDVFSCWHDEEVTCSTTFSVGAELWWWHGACFWETKNVSSWNTILKRETNKKLTFFLKPVLLLVVWLRDSLQLQVKHGSWVVADGME